MRGVIVVGVALLALTGCKSTAERAAEDDGYCQSLGAPMGSQPYVQCRLAQQERRDRRRAAIAGTDCFSTRMGSGIKTTCN